MNLNLIRNYGKVLKDKTQSTPIDLSKKININFSFQIHKINDLINEFNGNMPPNKFPQHVLAIIKKGSGTKQIGPIKFNINENMIFFIGKSNIHSSHNWLLDTEGYMLSFSDSYFIENNINIPLSIINLLSLKPLKPYKELNIKDANVILNIFSSIELEKKKKHDIYKNEIIATKVLELLYRYLREFNLNDRPKTNNIYDKFVKILENNFHRKHLVKYYSQELNIHPNYLNQIIKSETGDTVKNIIRNRIIIEVKYLLCNTNLSIKEISAKLGFIDQNTLSRYFKTSEGLSLKDYKKKYI